MPYCSRCGVEVDPHVETCPLCATPIMHFDDLPTTQSAYPPAHASDPSKVFATAAEKRARVFWSLATLLIIPSFILLSIDLFSSGHFSWSLIPVAALFASVLYLIVGLNFYNAFLAITGGFVVITAIFLFVLDLLDGPKSWYLPLGLPIQVLLTAVLFAAYFVILKFKTKGYNVFATVLTAITVFCLGLDFLIHLYANGRWEISWSLLIVLALLPIALYLFLLHYGLKRSLNFKRTFHV